MGQGERAVARHRASVSGSGTSQPSSPSDLSYTPVADYYGIDSFVVRVSDGIASDTITVNVTVNPRNDVDPEITEGDSVSVTLDEDNSPDAFILTLNATDSDNDSLTWSIGTPAAHGTADASGTGTFKAVTYMPYADYNGSDSFTVKVDDASAVPALEDDEITVNVTINPRNDPPVNTVQPTFSGTMFSGETLSIINGDVWNDTKDTASGGTTNITQPVYQWQRADDNADTNLTDIGATDSDYDLTSADNGKYVRLKATVQDDGIGDPTPALGYGFSDYRGVPEIITDAETSVGTTSADFNGTVKSLGEIVPDIRFEYGTTTAYGSEISASQTSVSAGKHTDTQVSGTPLTLGAGIVYHYRAVATVGGFDIYGDDRLFAAATTELPAPGKALSFDGTDDVTAELATAATDDITIEAYVKWSGGTGQTVVYNGTDGTNGYSIRITPEISVECGGSGSAVSAVQFAPGSWQHVAVVREAGTWKLYLNGLERPLTGNPSPLTPTGTTEIGTGFSGQLDEVRIWNTARTLTEIQDNMFQALTGTEPGLAAYYHFDHASGTVVTDRTSAHKDGTFVSSLSWADSAAFTT